jgi:AraC-like DNA-binding protein
LRDPKGFDWWRRNRVTFFVNLLSIAPLKLTLSDDMGSNRFVSVDFAEISPVYCCSNNGEFVRHAPITREWGTITLQNLSIENIGLVFFEGKIEKDIHIKEHSSNESTTVNSCFSLSGSVRSSFKGMQLPMCLDKGLQNFVYKPSIEDDHYVFAQNDPIRLVHFAIDRDYFAGLLDNNEWWSADLKAKLQAGELVYGCGEDMKITRRMNAILLDLLHCPLNGAMRKLVIEANVIELIAYQLDHFFSRERCNRIRTTLNERDAFYALRDHLAATFHCEHSLQSLSKTFCLNEFKLKKGFKELFGETVFGYIHSLRMQHAKDLLLDGELNVNEISGKVGYKNPNHFSTAFKKQFGITPSLVRV